ncbi:MAG: peroxiredoxin family protein [Blastococcus sp.]
MTLKAGDKAPGFTVDSLNGQGKLAISPGKVTIVDFWATWCEPCKKSFPEKTGFDYPLLADVGGTVAAAYGVKRGALMGKLAPVKRATFVIGADGVIKEVITSETKMNAHADTALEVLARG